MESNLITVGQAAEALGFSVQHTRLLIRQGKLRALKVGRDWVIPRDEVSEYLTRYRNNRPLDRRQEATRQTAEEPQ